MAFIRNEIERESTPPAQQRWYAEIAKNVADLTTQAFVVIPDWDETLMWGPCRWQSRDAVTLPQKGDPCLVVFDSRNSPWILAWWPF